MTAALAAAKAIYGPNVVRVDMDPDGSGFYVYGRNGLPRYMTINQARKAL